MTLRIFSLRNQELLAALLLNCAWKERQAGGKGGGLVTDRWFSTVLSDGVKK